MTDNLDNEMEIEIKQNKEDKLEIQKELDIKDENKGEVSLEDKFLDVEKSKNEYSIDCTTGCTTGTCYTRTQCIETMEAPCYPVELYNERTNNECFSNMSSVKKIVFILIAITMILSYFVLDNYIMVGFSLSIFIWILIDDDILNKPHNKIIPIHDKLDTSKLLLDTLNKKIKLAPKYNIEIHEYLEFAIKVENEIEKIRSNISNIFTENELITNGKDVQKHCDIVDEHNKKISDVLSKLNNELADQILKQ